jgi:hypothetical protein
MSIGFEGGWASVEDMQRDALRDRGFRWPHRTLHVSTGIIEGTAIFTDCVGDTHRLTLAPDGRLWVTVITASGYPEYPRLLPIEQFADPLELASIFRLPAVWKVVALRVALALDAESNHGGAS